MGEDDRNTTPPADRVLSQAQVSGTGIVQMHKDDNNTTIEAATIAADVEKARIAGNLALAKLIAMWASGVIGAVTLVLVVGLALYYGQGVVAIVIVGLTVAALAVYLGRSFVFNAFGTKVGTGAAVATVSEPNEKPQPPAGTDATG
jgi:VIT1/CCC1 family predicted Fe2+/Mn2+ transporter